MEEETDVVVGLDIGTTKIVAVVGCRDQATGKIKILGYGKTESTGVVRGAVMNITKTAEAVKRAVEQASDNANVDICEVYVGIAGQHIESFIQSNSFIRSNSEEVVTRAEIEKLKQEASKGRVDPGKKIIHVVPQTFTVDGVSGFREDEFEGMTGANVEVNYNIITADSLAMRNIQKSVETAGLEIKGFILEPLVSAEAVLDSTDKDAGVVLVDIGGGTTDVAIFGNGVLRHTAVIPLAGNLITSDIQRACTIMQRQAEALKTRFGSALPSEESEEKIVTIPAINGKSVREISLKQLATIIKGRVDEIFGQVSYEVGNCNLDTDQFIGGVVLTGGGSKMKHIDTVCEYITQLDTRLACPNKHLSPDSPKDLNDPIFATAVGLVIYGVRSEEENNLIHVPLDTQGGKETPDDVLVTTPPPVEGNSDAATVETVPAAPKSNPNPKKPWWRGRDGSFFGMGQLGDYIVKVFDDDVQ
ncbi:MAG: cell division protein FtsA [Bacteroidales bacterium]|nr:cell division protein FtsA [Bacteroidales bacterium]